MDEETKQFFEEQKKVKANQVCVDCGAANPQWASVPLGCYVCLECSGKHRSLGTHLSFVRSIEMDKWKEIQKMGMKFGGNADLNALFEKYGLTEMSIEEKYNTKAVEYYRQHLRCLVDDREKKPQAPSIEEGAKRYVPPPPPPRDSAASYSSHPYHDVKNTPTQNVIVVVVWAIILAGGWYMFF
mmetsp:Transcript_44374/g.83179  ORF Transcript_44374/g.83179 Transcript_44374/m.83179 type:complete len:184 (+) Transcript_44374:90-641(+)